MEIKEFFEPVLNFIKNLQKKDKEPASKQAAKDRLKLVLMQDRASVSPDFFEMMKKEIIDVIKKYIEIDEEALEVEITRGLESGLDVEGPALCANIPIKNVKPIAPKKESEDNEEERIMSEEEAEQAAENILNSIENISSKKEEEIVVEEIKGEETLEEKEDQKEEVLEKEEKEEKEKKEEKSKTKVKTTKSTKTRKKVISKKKNQEN
mgnify:CR=1 FL=1